MKFSIVYCMAFLLLGCLPLWAHVEKPIDTKRIALTFDDAPRGAGPVFDNGNDRGVAFIESLDHAATGPVAFFVTTGGLSNPGAGKRIENYAKAGHLIANHSDTHSWASRTDVADYLADIDSAETKLARLAVAADQRRAWFRFPYLDEGTPLEKRDAIRAGLKERELMNGYVTVDNYDWLIESEWLAAVGDGKTIDTEKLRKSYVDILMSAVKFYDEVAVSWIGRSPIHVILLHENDINALYIGDLVDALRRDGWEIVSPDIAYADPINDVTPTTLKTRQGHLAALAIEAGLDPRTLTHLAIEEDQIRALLDERGVFGNKQ